MSDIRVCPERDARCPHGMKCPFVLDAESCKTGWNAPPYLAAEITRLRAELAEAQRERDTFLTAGIAELAARNPNLMDYAEHWEGRARKAERDRDAAKAEAERLREALDATLSRFQSFKFSSLGDYYDPGKDADFADARAALQEKPHD